MRSRITAILLYALLAIPVCTHADSGISYPLVSAPLETDNLIGIDNPGANPGWSVGRFSISSILDLFLSRDNIFTGAVVPKIITDTGAACTTNEVGVYPSGVTGSRWYICEDGAWVSQTTAVASNPGGSNTQIQYNSNGVFAGIPNFVYVAPNLYQTDDFFKCFGDGCDWSVGYDTADGRLEFRSSSSSDMVAKFQNDGGGNAVVEADVFSSTATPTPGNAYMDSDIDSADGATAAQKTIAQTVGSALSTTPGSEDGAWTLSVKNNGTMVEGLHVDGAAQSIRASMPFVSRKLNTDITADVTLTVAQIDGRDYIFTSPATATMPAASGVFDGQNTCFKNQSGGTARVDVDAADSIRLVVTGSAQTTLGAGVAVVSVGDGQIICLEERGVSGWDAMTPYGWASE
jgi:hypothetical protein